MSFSFTDHITPLFPQGKPRPVVNWLKDGEPLENKSVGIRTSDFDTILFIRSAERDHSGTYTLSVQIDNMQDKADIHIQIVGQSLAPTSLGALVKSSALYRQ